MNYDSLTRVKSRDASYNLVPSSMGPSINYVITYMGGGLVKRLLYYKRGRGLAKRLQYYIGGVWLKDYNITPPTHLLTREKLRS